MNHRDIASKNGNQMTQHIPNGWIFNFANKDYANRAFKLMVHEHDKTHIHNLSGSQVKVIERPNISYELTLFDDESTREKYKVLGKVEITEDDARNNLGDLGDRLEDFLQFGKSYKITIQQMD